MKPILFNTAMVQAILEGRKTTTRRIIKVNSSFDFIGCSSEDGCEFNRAAFGKGSFDKLLDAEIKERIKAPYMPNDILYVRETWCKGKVEVADNGELYISQCTGDENIIYKQQAIENDVNISETVWKPSIFMPKEVARIFLKVTSVKVERLQDIDDEGAKAEGSNVGIGIAEKMKEGAIDRFKRIWNSTVNKKDIDKYGWNANPYVWVIEFERIEKSEVEQ